MSESKNRLIIFDTTLRDGEQSPGASMNLPEKLEIARALDDLGVDIIEAGFPIASEADAEAVRQRPGQFLETRGIEELTCWRAAVGPIRCPEHGRIR